MNITLPKVIQDMLGQGAVLVISISGGKDSTGMLQALARHHKENNLPGPCLAVHADLGRAEWYNTLDQCYLDAQRCNVPLTVVKRENGDLVDVVIARKNALEGTGKPFWPSSAARYCTSSSKREPINKYLRKFDLVISAEGVRAEESPARSKKSVIELRKEITASRLRELSPEEALNKWQPGERLAVTWRPIFHWPIEEVWKELGTSPEDLYHRRTLYQKGEIEKSLAGWNTSPAYVFGSTRLSCALCIMASRNDLIIGAKFNPNLADLYLSLENETGCTFQAKDSLNDILTSSPSLDAQLSLFDLDCVEDYEDYC